MVSPTDPNQVLLTGENSFMRLSHEDGGPLTVRASHWRVLLSPGGPGHVLFLSGEVTDDEVQIYTDNVAMTRWLQGEIQGLLTPEFGDQDIPVIDAEFERLGDVRSFSTETVVSRDADIAMTWYDFAEPLCHPGRPGQHTRQAPRRVQRVHPGPQGFPDLQRRRLRRQALPCRPGRPREQHRLPGLVGDLGQTPLASPSHLIR